MSRPSKRSSTLREDSRLPSGLESDPIAHSLLKMGLPVTREEWMMASFGTAELDELGPEDRAATEHLFPE